MQIEKIKGIVIKDTDFGETSKVLNVITEKYGLIGIMSKGSRSVKSKLRSVSSKFTYGYFHINYKENGLSNLIEVDIIDEFKNIKTDLIKIGYSSYLVDFARQVVQDTLSNFKEVFDILEDALKKINEGFDSAIITNIVELKYLSFLGVSPHLDKCSVCGSKNNIITINSDAGGYLCKNCYKNEYIVDEKTIKLIRMFEFLDISKIKELNIKDKNKLEINKFLEDYYDRYTGLYLKSKNFLNQIK